jgi:cell division protein FtsQ
MARKSGSTIMQEELYPPSAPPVREELDDARLVDLDVDEESPFLRAQKRVPARRGPLPKKTAHRLLWSFAAATVLGVLAVAAGALYHYGERSWRFRIESSDNIDVAGMENVTKAQIMEVMGADIGRNIFFIPLAQQKTQLEQIPWVEAASVMRFVPNRLRVEIHERTPVAFARVGPRIFLIDGGGTLMELPQKHKYSFPVILGMNPGEPLSTRIPRMKAFNELVRDLDSGGARYSQDLSEVDLSDLEDIKVRVNDPHGDVQVELGSTDFLKRYRTYVSHVQEWRQQFQKLESVNLRYDNQVIVNPEMEGKPKQAALTASAVRAAAAAGVKPAALISRINPQNKTVPKPAFELSEKKLEPAKPAVARKPAPRARVRKAVVKSVSAATPRKEVSRHAAGKGKPATAHAAAKPAWKKPPQSAMLAHSGGAKPSAAISKQNAGSN